MRLTEEQKRIFADHLNECCKELSCPCCGRGNWLLQDGLFSLASLGCVSFGFGTLMDDQTSVVIAMCQRCGFTAPFAATKVGIEET